jgi:drug/metabolite transporter (DMT)-like permease
VTTARPAVGVLMVTTAAALWGLNGTVSKLLIQGGFDPPQLTTFRATGAFLGLLVFILVTRGPRTLAARGRELPRLIAYGLPGLFAVPLLYFVAISRLPVGIGLLFEFTAPVFVALWMRFGERRPVHRRLWLGLVLCVAGLISVAQLWTGRLRLDGLGVLAGLTCAVLLALYYVLGSKLVGGDAPARDPMSLTCWAFGISAVAGAVVRPWWHFDGQLLAGQSGGVPRWLLAGYLIVFGTIVPYVLTTFAMRHLPATSVGIIGIVEVAWASAFAWVLLAEALGPAQIVGGLILVVGVALAESARVTTARAGALKDRTPPAAGVVQDPRGDQPAVRAGR